MKNNSVDNPAVPFPEYMVSFGCASLDDLAREFDEATLDQPDYEEKFAAACDAFYEWQRGGAEIPDDLLPYMTWSARRYRLGVLYGEIPNPNNWLTDADEFIATELPARTPYLV